MTGAPQTLADFAPDILIYGCGTMAGAMLRRWLACGLSSARVVAIRRHGVEPAPGITTLTDASTQTSPAILVVGIKPQMMRDHAIALARLAGPGTLVLSILAGVTLDDLTTALPHAGAIVRAMPNMPVADGRGIVVTAGDAGNYSAALDTLLEPLGLHRTLTDETLFDVVTALTGCGPAFVYRFAAALADAATALGLDPVEADVLARATLAGSATALASSAHGPDDLASAVASPGGMTRAGLDVLDDDARLNQLMRDTLAAARDRGAALAQAARTS